MPDKPAAHSVNEPGAPAPDTSPISINEPPGSVVEGFSTEAQKQALALPQVKAGMPPTAKASADPDDLEDEIDAAEDDDDVDVKHGGKSKKKR